jgi:hypothetical protein
MDPAGLLGKLVVFLRPAKRSGRTTRRFSAALSKAAAEGPMAALDDRPRPDKKPSFIAVDFHPLLLAGLPAHSPQFCLLQNIMV